MSAGDLEAMAREAVSAGDWERAASLFERLVASDPRQPRYRMNFALALTRACGALDPRSIFAYRQVLIWEPARGRAWSELSPVIGDQAWLRAAAAGDNRVVTLKATAAIVQANGRADLALPWLDRLLAMDPDDTQARTNRAMARVELGQTQGALDDLSQVLMTSPADSRARYTRGWLRLSCREWIGWEDYLARWSAPEQGDIEYKVGSSFWDGQECKHGPLHLWGQFGVGDEILFAGLVEEAATQAAVPTRLECDQRLVPLFRRSFENVEVLPRDAPSTAISASAVQASTACLPAYLRRSLDAFPDRRSYLVADPERVAVWRARLTELGPPPYTGFAWRSGNARTAGRKSIPLDALSPLIDAAGGTAISLQYSPDPEEEVAAKALGAQIPLQNPAPNIRDNIDDLAAQIAALDRVVTISGINAHLAGALGVPGIVLMQRDPLWFWFHSGAESPWYPSLVVLRQDAKGRWDDALSAAVRHLAEGGHPR